MTEAESQPQQELPLHYSKEARKKITAQAREIERLKKRVDWLEAEWWKLKRENNNLLQSVSSSHAFINKLYGRLDVIKADATKFFKPFDADPDAIIAHKESMVYREKLMESINGLHDPKPHAKVLVTLEGAE